METVLLSNGVRMPLLGLGTWELHGSECVQSVRAALEVGFRLIDTAKMYGNEAEVGRGIKASGVHREEIFLTTKVYRSSGTYAKAKKAIEQSLRALGTDYVDLLLLHEPYPKAADIYRAIEEAYQEGKARAIGISNYDAEHYERFLAHCTIPPMVNQVETHVFFQRWALQNQLNRDGVIMQAWAPLGSGQGSVPQQPLLAEIGSHYGKSLAQVALRFLIQRGIPIIPKSHRIERLRENAAIFDFTLTEEDLATIRTLDTNNTFFPWTKAY